VPETQLTPRQEDIVHDLLQVTLEPPVFDRQLGRDLRAEMNERLRAIAEPLGKGEKFTLAKNLLGAARTCEGFLAADTFSWSVPAIRGRVVHRALELLILDAAPWQPLDAVTAGYAAVENDDPDSPGSAGNFLRQLDAAYRAAIIRDAVDACTKFVEDWPRIPAAWHPRVESAANISFGPIRLRAVSDLALSIPVGERRRDVVIDYKTGAEYLDHRQDMHFYALMHTLRSGTPPHRVATYYLDEGSWTVDDVTPGVIEAAKRQVLAAAEIKVRILTSGPGEYRPGPTCRFCPVADACSHGQDWLAANQRAA